MNRNSPGDEEYDRSKPGPKFGVTEREGVLALVARLDRIGYNQYDIAREIGREFRGKQVSQQYVSVMLKEIRERYLLQQKVERQHLIAVKIEQYRDIYRQAYEAWVRSSSGLERTTEESVLRPQPKTQDPVGKRVRGEKVDKASELAHRLVVIKRVVLKEGRAGAAEFLRVMAECLQAERELLGLDAPKKIEGEMKQKVTLDWDTELAPKDYVGEELAKVEGQAPLPSTNGESRHG